MHLDGPPVRVGRNFARQLYKGETIMTLEQFPRVPSKIGFLLLCLLFSGFAPAATPPTAYKVVQVAVKNATATFGQGLNTSGAVVGLYTTASATEGYMYASGKYSLIKVPKSNNVTRAFGINDSTVSITVLS
jgi:hypothetical protein